jgi:hypothetical protein
MRCDTILCPRLALLSFAYLAREISKDGIVETRLLFRELTERDRIIQVKDKVGHRLRDASICIAGHDEEKSGWVLQQRLTCYCDGVRYIPVASREPHRPPPALPPAAVKAHKRKSGARRCFIVMSGSGVQRLAVNQHS